MSLEIKVSEKDVGVVKVTLVGSIDTQTCPALEKKIEVIMRNLPNALMLDMEGVTYIMSMGLSLMVKTEKAIKAAGKTMLVVNIPPQIKKVFNIVNALPSMKIFKTIAEADAYLLKIQRREIEKDKSL